MSAFLDWLAGLPLLQFGLVWALICAVPVGLAVVAVLLAGR